jgi:hypothetical protein
MEGHHVQDHPNAAGGPERFPLRLIVPYLLARCYPRFQYCMVEE